MHVYDLSVNDLTAEQSVISELSRTGKTFVEDQQFKMDAYDRDVKEDKGISHNLFGYDLDSSVSVDWKDPEEVKNKGITKYNIDFEIQSEADGEGDSVQGKGINVFSQQIEIGIGGDGDGGEIFKHPKPKVFYSDYQSNYYMGDG
jgi:hypothetical protein